MSSAEGDYQAVSAFEISEPRGHRMEKGKGYRQYLVTIIGKLIFICVFF